MARVAIQSIPSAQLIEQIKVLEIRANIQRVAGKQKLGAFLSIDTRLTYLKDELKRREDTARVMETMKSGFKRGTM